MRLGVWIVPLLRIGVSSCFLIANGSLLEILDITFQVILLLYILTHIASLLLIDHF